MGPAGGAHGTPKPAVSRGDANAIGNYAGKWHGYKSRFGDLEHGVDGPVDAALKVLDGPWKADFLGKWAQISPRPGTYFDALDAANPGQSAEHETNYRACDG